jgi:hypothetical protein
MNNDFLVSPRDRNSFPSNESSPSELNRRAFLKRGGGATVAALVAWNASTSLALAGEGEGSSCPDEVAANPNLAVKYTNPVVGQGTYGSQYECRGAVYCSPPGNPAKAKTLTIILETWKTSDLSTKIYGPTAFITAYIDESNPDTCDFISSASHVQGEEDHTPSFNIPSHVHPENPDRETEYQVFGVLKIFSLSQTDTEIKMTVHMWIEAVTRVVDYSTTPSTTIGSLDEYSSAPAVQVLTLTKS